MQSMLPLRQLGGFFILLTYLFITWQSSAGLYTIRDHDPFSYSSESAHLYECVPVMC